MCVCVCVFQVCTYRVQYRCDEQVFPPQELTVHRPGVAVRVEPAGKHKNKYEALDSNIVCCDKSHCVITPWLSCQYQDNPQAR